MDRLLPMPLTWEELNKALKRGKPAELFYEPDAALKRIKNHGDLFAPLLKLKQSLPQPFLDLMTNSHPGKALETYRRKRDFTKTSEPAGRVPRSSRQGSRKLFVIQKHAASHLHYDFRLEMHGTLKSWAVPKRPPYDLNERRLAMATEDHPMDYAKFEGVIPQGEYGGGTVMVWDIGTYELIDGKYWKGKLHVHLNGKKLKGEWVLAKGRDQDKRENTWYLIKTGEPIKRLAKKTEETSALTGRSFDEIAAARDAVWHSNRNGANKTGTVRPRKAAQSTVANGDFLPSAKVRFVEPMLARAVAALPKAREEWFYEIKLDGYRTLAGRDGTEVKLWSRRGHLVTEQFSQVAKACEQLPANTLLDGEVVALDKSGKISFNLLQHHRSKASALKFYAFDALVVDGHNMMELPLTKRRAALTKVLTPDEESSALALSETLNAPPTELIRIVKEFGLEGIVAKRKDSIYEPGNDQSGR